MIGVNDGKTVTARYEDALRFIENMSDRKAEAMSAKLDDFDVKGFSMRLLLSASEVGGAMEAVAFCFGTTKDQVSIDKDKLFEGGTYDR